MKEISVVIVEATAHSVICLIILMNLQEFYENFIGLQ